MPEFDPATIRNRIVDYRLMRPGELADHPRQHKLHPGIQVESLRALLRSVGIAGALLAWRSEELGGKLATWDGHLRKSLDPDLYWPVLITDLTDAEADLMLLAGDATVALAQLDPVKTDALIQAAKTDEAAILALMQREAERAGLVYGHMRGREPEERQEASGYAPAEKFPLAIVLSRQEMTRWLRWKERSGRKTDKDAFLALLDGQDDGPGP